MRCDECRHWKKDAESYRGISDLGECKKVRQVWSSVMWVEDDDDENPLPIAVVPQELAGQMSFVEDVSDARASLWTKPAFFCTHYEAREGSDALR